MDSEKIMAYLKDYRYTIPVGVVLGLILGLIIGWGIWPVQWTDLAPYHLRQDLREDYLRMSIYTSTTIGDGSIATKAWMELEDTAEGTLEGVRNDPRYLNSQQITSFSAIVGAEAIQPTSTIEETEATEGQEEEGGPNWLQIGGLCLVLFVAAAVVIYFFVLRDRSKEGGQKEVLDTRGRFDRGYEHEQGQQRYVTQPEGEMPSQVRDEQSVPVAQYMTTYVVGDDMYDDSFSIDAPTGEFLGECGVGISEIVGIGEPKHVTAFEVWLFDKNDIQTVTKVVMSAHAYNDEKIRIRLESKGEPILAEQGKQILLETATLQLEARVIDMEYGVGAAPDESFFQRLTLELAVWEK